MRLCFFFFFGFMEDQNDKEEEEEEKDMKFLYHFQITVWNIKREIYFFGELHLFFQFCFLLVAFEFQALESINYLRRWLPYFCRLQSSDVKCSILCTVWIMNSISFASWCQVRGMLISYLVSPVQWCHDTHNVILLNDSWRVCACLSMRVFVSHMNFCNQYFKFPFRPGFIYLLM